MEANEITKMVEYALLHHYFIIDFIVNDDGSIMRAVLKNP